MKQGLSLMAVGQASSLFLATLNMEKLVRPATKPGHTESISQSMSITPTARIWSRTSGSDSGFRW
jgi:hypothetical protein